MASIDRELCRTNYHQARAMQERAAAARAADERSRQAHLHLAIVHEVRSLFGNPGDEPPP